MTFQVLRAKSCIGLKDAGHSVDIVFNDRTSSQLKGTGSMRLIRGLALFRKRSNP